MELVAQEVCENRITLIFSNTTYRTFSRLEALSALHCLRLDTTSWRHNLIGDISVIVTQGRRRRHALDLPTAPSQSDGDARAPLSSASRDRGLCVTVQRLLLTRP